MKRPLERFVWRAEPIKGSRFEAWVAPATTAEEALEVLEHVRATEPNATHHCWAFHLADGTTRSSDDGEPGGSAGRPILAQIEGHEVTDAMVVVVRWYGGTKLGVGGLIRAYGGTAGKALDRAPLEVVRATASLRFRYTYDDTTAVETALAGFDAEVERTWAAAVEAVATVDADRIEALEAALVERTAGRVQFLR